MKFQNRSIHGSKVNRRTDRQTDRQAESNMPFQLFQIGGIKTYIPPYTLRPNYEYRIYMGMRG